MEESLSFLTSQLEECRFKPKLLLGTDFRQTREEYCIQEISEKLDFQKCTNTKVQFFIFRFPIDPMDIVYLKKYLSKEKIEEMNVMLDNMKTSLVEIINNVEWIDEKDKDKIVPIIKKLKVIFGGVDNHFDDDILDKLVFKLVSRQL